MVVSDFGKSQELYLIMGCLVVMGLLFACLFCLPIRAK
jgi:hypothetical protein